MRLLNREHYSGFVKSLLERKNLPYGFIYNDKKIFDKYNLHFIDQRSEDWIKQAEAIKTRIYNVSFEADLDDVSRDASQGKIFSSLFHKSSSYYKGKYKPLDLVEIVLDGQDRDARKAFFRFLSGYCFLFSKPCDKCSHPARKLDHFLLYCPFFIRQRLEYFTYVRKMMADHNRPMLPLFNQYIHTDPQKAVLILLGANKILQQNSATALIRDTSKPTPQNCIPIKTAHFASLIVSSHPYVK